MTRFLAATVFLAGLTSLAWSCWGAIDPDAFAIDCPIIVAGTIESVAQAAPGGERADDTATIRITALHRNELTDVPLKVGDTLAVKMISKNNRLHASTDLNYPVKTNAVWLVVLTSKGEFRIDVHPVQKQQVVPPLGRIADVKTKHRDNDGQPVTLANPQGSKTKAEWVVGKKRQDREQAKSLAAHRAQQTAIRDLAKEFADAESLDEAIWKRFQASETDVRRGIFQLDLHEQPMTGPRLAEAAEGALAREKDDNIRTHAVSRLAYCRDPGVKGMQVLASALRDRSATVRLFACQAVKFRRHEQLADQVKALQNDSDPEVREMATQTLEFWRGQAK